jgi:tight adherence protein C
MTAAAAGGTLGLLLALGLLLGVSSSPPMRPIRLDERLSPYLRDAPRPSRLLVGDRAAPSTLVAAAARVFRPVIADTVRTLDRLVGGRGAVRRRLAELGSCQTVEEFRLEQVACGVLGLATAVLASGAIALVTGRFDALAVLALAAGGMVVGVLGRDWWLTRTVRRRHEAMLTELPVVADLLALAVTAGEGVAGAMERVCRLTRGEIARELSDALARAHAGAPLVDALEGLRDRTGLGPLVRFLDGIIVAVERGTPLAEVLRAQAADVREAGKRALLEAGGRKEILMMFPVVFLILPVTVLFALFPGLVNITELVQ